MGVVHLTEEFLRELIDHSASNVAREGLHGRLDALEGAVGRDELARQAAERERQAKAQETGRDPTLVADVPPGWHRLPDGSWEAVAAPPAAAPPAAAPPAAEPVPSSAPPESRGF